MWKSSFGAPPSTDDSVAASARHGGAISPSTQLHARDNVCSMADNPTHCLISTQGGALARDERPQRRPRGRRRRAPADPRLDRIEGGRDRRPPRHPRDHRGHDVQREERPPSSSRAKAGCRASRDFRRSVVVTSPMAMAAPRGADADTPRTSSPRTTPSDRATSRIAATTLRLLPLSNCFTLTTSTAFAQATPKPVSAAASAARATRPLHQRPRPAA